MQPHAQFSTRSLLACLLFLFALPAHVLAVAEPVAEPEPNPEVGVGAATTLVATQMATTTFAGSLFTVGTSVSATWVEFTQTFATTALGTWALGPTPASGRIGLGTIVGTVGKVKSKRAEPTPEFAS
jgi:hypothetical protein